MRFSNWPMLAVFLLAACSQTPKTPQQPVDETPNDVTQAVLEQEVSEKDKLLASANLYQQGEVSDAATVLFNKALTLKQSGELAQASVVFEQMLQEYPNLSGSALQLADIAKQQNNQVKQLAMLQKALEINPHNYIAANQLALIMREQGDFSKALALYQSAINAWPGYALSYYNLGILYDLYLGEKDKALTQFETYLLLQESDSSASYKQVSLWIMDLKRQLAQGAKS